MITKFTETQAFKLVFSVINTNPTVGFFFSSGLSSSGYLDHDINFGKEFAFCGSFAIGILTKKILQYTMNGLQIYYEVVALADESKQINVCIQTIPLVCKITSNCDISI